ncbi:MAG: CBS domain-containing protein [Deltaproteobacteria bacterium]|nr:CBS domain-containing protein [Deltaproteobacteria bacterium]
MTLPISHIMRTKLVFCEENSSLKSLAEMLLDEEVGSVIVNRGEESVGLVTNRDILRAAFEGMDFVKATAGQIMGQPLAACDADSSLEDALQMFKQTGRNRLVITREGKTIGVLKQSVAQRFKGIAGMYQFSPRTRSLPFRRGSGSTLS